MNGHDIDCVKATALRNQNNPLTPEENDRLTFHLASCGECREGQICCADALELIDQLPPAEAARNMKLNLHISTCPECGAASILEPDLRRAIAPRALPSPSLDFEAMLASKLDIRPATVYVPSPADVIAKDDPVSQWSWAVAAVTLAVVISAQLPKIYSFFTRLPDLFMKFLAFLASHLTGESAVIYSGVKSSYSALTMENLSLWMIVTIIGISLTVAGRILTLDD